NEKLYANTLNNLGFSYYKIGNKKGLIFLKQSLNIRKKINDNNGMVESYMNLSRFHTISNPKIAVQYAKMAYEKASEVNNVDDRLKLLALLIEKSSKYESKIYSKQYIHISD